MAELLGLPEAGLDGSQWLVALNAVWLGLGFFAALRLLAEEQELAPTLQVALAVAEGLTVKDDPALLEFGEERHRGLFSPGRGAELGGWAACAHGSADTLRPAHGPVNRPLRLRRGLRVWA